MRYVILDIESVPKSEKELLEMMDSDLRNPVMPESILNPQPPDFSKCPKYEREKNPEGSRQAWIEKTRLAFEQDGAKARSEWQLKASEARQRWIDDAALHAPRSSVKLIGLRDVQEGVTSLMVIDATAEERKRIEAEPSWPCKVKFNFLSEVEALNAFASFAHANIGRIYLDDGKPDGKVKKIEGKFIGYYIAGFDFPYLIRRAMITGAKSVLGLLRKGPRYWNDETYLDLDEAYKLGERDLKIGGMDGLAKIVGVPQKTGDGESFYLLWQENPIAAINYNLHDLDVIESCARKMGVIQ